jgi:hypothetical protein
VTRGWRNTQEIRREERKPEMKVIKFSKIGLVGISIP